jgi:hypothetical protein
MSTVITSIRLNFSVHRKAIVVTPYQKESLSVALKRTGLWDVIVYL